MKKRTSKAIFSEILPVPGATPGRQQELRELNKWLRNWCREEGFGFMENWADFSVDYHLYGIDGLHLNGRGAAFLGAKMAKTFLNFKLVAKKEASEDNLLVKMKERGSLSQAIITRPSSTSPSLS